MSKTQLSSRERVLRALERRDHDRVPRHENYWRETVERWQAEGLKGDAEYLRWEVLKDDFGGVSWSWPVPFPGQHRIVRQDDETYDVFGPMGKVERHFRKRTGTPLHISFDCDRSEKWYEIYKPALLKARMSFSPGKAVELSEVAQRGERFKMLRGVEAFEAMRQLVGDEVLLIAMASEPDWVRDMSRTYTDLLLGEWQAALDAGARADCLWPYGDLGYNHGPLMSPAMYRELLLPDHQRLVDWAHGNGMKFIYHTDGDVRSLIPIFIEAGFDCIQPMEAKAGLDVRELAPQYGKDLSFFGNIDMTVASTNDREKVEHEIRTKLQAAMPYKGYLFHSDHSVPPSVSWQTYQFMLECSEKYGTYA